MPCVLHHSHCRENHRFSACFFNARDSRGRSGERTVTRMKPMGSTVHVLTVSYKKCNNVDALMHPAPSIGPSLIPDTILCHALSLLGYVTRRLSIPAICLDFCLLSTCHDSRFRSDGLALAPLAIWPSLTDHPVGRPMPSVGVSGLSRNPWGLPCPPEYGGLGDVCV